MAKRKKRKNNKPKGWYIYWLLNNGKYVDSNMVVYGSFKSAYDWAEQYLDSHPKLKSRILAIKIKEV